MNFLAVHYIYNAVDRCAMAILHSRFKRVIYGAPNMQFGGLGTRYNVHVEKSLNHRFEVYKGLLRDQCNEVSFKSKT